MLWIFIHLILCVFVLYRRFIFINLDKSFIVIYWWRPILKRDVDKRSSTFRCLTSGFRCWVVLISFRCLMVIAPNSVRGTGVTTFVPFLFVNGVLSVSERVWICRQRAVVCSLRFIPVLCFHFADDLGFLEEEAGGMSSISDIERVPVSS